MRRPVRRALIGATVALVAAGAITAGVVVSTSHVATAKAPAPAAAAAAATPTPTPASSLPPISASPAKGATTKTITNDSAGSVVASYVDKVDSTSPTTALTAFTGLVTGKALQETQAQLSEFKANGWSLKGKTVVDFVKLGKTTGGAHPTAVIAACIDSSNVTVVNHAGRPVYHSNSAARRAINLYTLAYEQGAWRITLHSFPNDPTC